MGANYYFNGVVLKPKAGVVFEGAETRTGPVARRSGISRVKVTQFHPTNLAPRYAGR